MPDLLGGGGLGLVWGWIAGAWMAADVRALWSRLAAIFGTVGGGAWVELFSPGAARAFVASAVMAGAVRLWFERSLRHPAVGGEG